MKMFANNEHIVPYYSNNAINIKSSETKLQAKKKKGWSLLRLHGCSHNPQLTSKHQYSITGYCYYPTSLKRKRRCQQRQENGKQGRFLFAFWINIEKVEHNNEENKFLQPFFWKKSALRNLLYVDVSICSGSSFISTSNLSWTCNQTNKF
jgi:hypothetical protein